MVRIQMMAVMFFVLLGNLPVHDFNEPNNFKGAPGGRQKRNCGKRSRTFLVETFSPQSQGFFLSGAAMVHFPLEKYRLRLICVSARVDL